MSTVIEKQDSEDVGHALPPFLRRVRIRGYKSIAFCDVALSPLTILVGRNASGKSNFIDALAFLRDVIRFGVNEAVKRHGGADAILHRTQQGRAVSVAIECEYAIGEDDRWQASYRLDVELPPARAAKIRREELRIEQGEKWVAYVNDDGRVEMTIVVLDEFLDRHLIPPVNNFDYL